MATTKDQSINIPTNMSTSDILQAIDTLCARLADNGEVDEAWKIRHIIDSLQSGIVDYNAGDEAPKSISSTTGDLLVEFFDYDADEGATQ
jgi:hypothetical protein